MMGTPHDSFGTNKPIEDERTACASNDRDEAFIQLALKASIYHLQCVGRGWVGHFLDLF